MHRIGAYLVILIALTTTGTGTATAQNLRVTGVGATSSQSHLDGGLGFGVFGTFAVTEHLGVSAGVAQVRSQSERVGMACVTVRPFPRRCEEDLLGEQARLRSYRAGVQASVPLPGSVRMATGMGASLNEVRTSSVGLTTELPGTLYSPAAANPGGFLEVDLVWNATRELALVLSASGGWVSFRGCSAEPFTYAPFCGGERIMELHLGMAYRIFY